MCGTNNINSQLVNNYCMHTYIQKEERLMNETKRAGTTILD